MTGRLAGALTTLDQREELRRQRKIAIAAFKLAITVAITNATARGAQPRLTTSEIVTVLADLTASYARKVARR